MVLEHRGKAPLAFENVTVVPIDEERVLPSQTVLIEGDRIARIGPAAELEPPDGTERIDGRGRFLMPGLFDMHVHFRDPGFGPLFVANGVTSVRNMWGELVHRNWQRRIARLPIVAPYLYTTGPIIDGWPPIWSGSVVVTRPEDAEEEVAEQHAAGFRAIKVYDNLSAPVYEALVAAARRRGMQVVGHVPRGWP